MSESFYCHTAINTIREQVRSQVACLSNTPDRNTP